MSAPQSAFAVYKQNKVQNYNKKQQKKKKRQANASAVQIVGSSVAVPEFVVRATARKLKKNKNNNKKKANKKMKEKFTNKVQKPSKQAKNTKVNIAKPIAPADVSHLNGEPDSDCGPPLLVPAARSAYVAPQSDSSDCSDVIDFVPVRSNSFEEGLNVFNWIIAPYSSTDFFHSFWEKKPLLVTRKNSRYFKEVISTPIIDDMLRNHNIRYTRNIDITSYVNGQRDTHNLEGEPRAMPRAVWDEYQDGCSIRLKNPQTYIPKIHLINATLQELFNTFVGANVYLTPPDSQGFAPHYDDIEAFILQVEGKKHWKVYKPLSKNETLPRFSSRNFNQNEIGEPILEVTLEAGDMLYFPRGFVHQAVTVDGEHSLHVTLSMYQRHSYADLFEKLIPMALRNAISGNERLRRGLPFDIYDNFGLINAEVNTPRKAKLTRYIHALCDLIKENLPLEDAVDEMAKQFQRTALPPVLTDMERMVSNFGDHDRMVKDGKVIHRVELQLDTKIRLLRKNILRMVAESAPGEAGQTVGAILVYFNVDNSLEYEGRDPQHILVDETWIKPMETLTTTYPEYVSVENLGASESRNMEIANILWDIGVIISEEPLGYEED